MSFMPTGVLGVNYLLKKKRYDVMMLLMMLLLSRVDAYNKHVCYRHLLYLKATS